MKKPIELDPYHGGLTDSEFLSMLGIGMEEVSQIASMLKIPASEPTQSYDGAKGKIPFDLADVNKVRIEK